ncbi:MAG: hypothetical protein DRO88_13545 [Promethearchaeia archaeon]|nr:MAG: hypothetical protein DRO88_13545 [Candidatus Lokiarchaeia archaeon]
MGILIKRQGRFQSWEYQETMTSGTYSEPLRIPPFEPGQQISVSLVIDTGEGKIQFTTSGDDNIDSAIWQDWPLGACIETQSDLLLSPVTAIRLVRISGTVTMEVVT